MTGPLISNVWFKVEYSWSSLQITLVSFASCPPQHPHSSDQRDHVMGQPCSCVCAWERWAQLLLLGCCVIWPNPPYKVSHQLATFFLEKICLTYPHIFLWSKKNGQVPTMCNGRHTAQKLLCSLYCARHALMQQLLKFLCFVLEQ
jgi:hypothetical protein